MPLPIRSRRYAAQRTIDLAIVTRHSTQGFTPALHHLHAYGPPRERTIAWHDPTATVEPGRRLSGHDYLTPTLEPAATRASDRVTTIELKVSFLPPVRAGDTLLAHGWITKPGRCIAFAEADLRDGENQLVATASSSLLVITRPATEQRDASDGNTVPQAREERDRGNS